MGKHAGRFWLIGLLLLITAVAQAGNRHEHLYALPTFDAMVEAYRETTKQHRPTEQTLTERKFGALVRRPTEAIRSVFGDETAVGLAAELGMAGFNPDNAESRKALDAAVKDFTFAELTERMSKGNRARDAKFTRPEDVTRSWFEFTELTAKNPTSYQTLEDVRRELMSTMLEENPAEFATFLEKAVRKTYQGTDYSTRSILDLSVPKRLFNATTYNATVRGSNARVSFLFSLPRGQLVSMSPDELEAELEMVKKGIKERWARGIDVTGSIQEAKDAAMDVEGLTKKVEALEAQRTAADAQADRLLNQAKTDAAEGREAEANEKRAEGARLRDAAKRLRAEVSESKKLLSLATSKADALETRLTRVLTAMSEVGGEIRLHAYETARTGPFYTAMRKALTKWKLNPGPKPAKIRIGHVAAMNVEDANFLEQLAKEPRLQKKIAVECSPESNHILHGATYQNIMRNLMQLSGRGIPVLLGADDQGILGRESSLLTALEKLRKAGAPEELLITLLKDSLDLSRAGGRTVGQVLKAAECSVIFRAIAPGTVPVPQ